MQLKRYAARMLRIVGGAIAGLCVWGLALEPAHAYPQFQLATGNARCNQCHYAPAGGGLINGYGRDEAEGSLSQTAGSAGFAHGLFELPDWIALGGDLRVAGVVKGSGTHPQFFAFPMQVDVYSRFEFGSFSVNTILGMRGSAREGGAPLIQRFLTREHTIMWQPDETGWYARAGRFFAPYGLRLQDHTSYVRRYLGQHTLEETYNLSVGNIQDEWEVHATAFVPPSSLKIPFFLGGDVGTPSKGVAVYYERRGRDDTLAYGGQTRVELGDENRKYWVGGVGKLWLESAKLLLMSELDIGVQTFSLENGSGGRDGHADPRFLLAFHLGATYYLKQGILLGAAIERYDPHVALSGSARDSVNVSAQWLFRSHWELVALGKVDFQQDFGSASPLGMLMLHYYL